LGVKLKTEEEELETEWRGKRQNRRQDSKDGDRGQDRGK
jgi:hypothetical protein